MLKIRYGRIKGHAFLFKYETTVELKALITKFQNEIDLVFCEVYLAHNGQAVRHKHQQFTISEDYI